MKFIGVWIAKGGTGKTTTAGNLAAALAARGRVLLIDCDGQGNMSAYLRPEGFAHELADVLKGQVSAREAIVNARPGLDLLPTFAIGGGLKNWAETVLPGQPFAFHTLRDSIEALGYDYAIADMSPGTSFLERAIISAADEILPVVRPEVFAVDGLEVFADTLEMIRRDLRAKATAPRLVVNGVNLSFAIHRAYFDALRARPEFQVFAIGQTVKASEAQGAHRFLGEHDPKNPALTEYARLAEAVA